MNSEVKSAPPANVDGRSVRLPRGVRDYLPEAAALRRGIAEAVLAEVERWGYRRIITPAFEYESVMSRGLGASAQAQAVRFVEPGTGEVVMLRPDITPQVARLVATRLGHDEGPLRLSYEGGVTRLSHGGQRELFQAGVELVGAPAPAGDVEVIALAAAALQAAGVKDFVLDLGEAQLVRAALEGIEGKAGAELESAIARKDVDEVERIARGLALTPLRRKLLGALPSLYGGPEVIDQAMRLLDMRSHKAAYNGLRALKTIVARLGAWRLDERVSIDLGEVRGFDYYTGVRFSGYAPGVGDALLSGGRYDHLVERYGQSAAAAGFAVDVEKVALALPAEQPLEARGVYLAGEPSERHRVAQVIRGAGSRVVEDLDEQVGADAALRERAVRAGAVRVLIVTRDGARWLAVEGNARGTVSAARLEALGAGGAGGETLDAILGAGYPAPAPGSAKAAKKTGSSKQRGTAKSWQA